MVTPKPAFGHTKSYAYLAYNPSDNEVSALSKEIEIIIQQPTNERFRKTIWQLITILRQTVDYYNNAPKPDNSLQEMHRLIKVMDEIEFLLNPQTGLNPNTRHHLNMELMSQNFVDEDDVMYQIHVLSKIIKDVSESTLERIVGAKDVLKNSSYVTPHQIRQMAAEELARALDNDLNYKPGKTRNGPFDKCFRLLLNAINCEVDGNRIILSPPENTFHIIKDAIDAYPSKPKFCLLEVKKFPGLTD